jgi:hypothetical protein
VLSFLIWNSAWKGLDSEAWHYHSFGSCSPWLSGDVSTERLAAACCLAGWGGRQIATRVGATSSDFETIGCCLPLYAWVSSSRVGFELAKGREALRWGLLDRKMKEGSSQWGDDISHLRAEECFAGFEA